MFGILNFSGIIKTGIEQIFVFGFDEIMSEKNKKDNGKSNEKKKNDFGIDRDDKILMMLESMRDEIGLVAEGVEVVNKKLEDFKDEMYGFRDEMYEFQRQTEANFKAVFDFQSASEEYIELNFKKVFEEIKDIKKRLSKVETILLRNEKKNSKMQDEIRNIKKDIRAGKRQAKSVVALQQFRSLERRVAKLEAKNVK